MRVQNSAGLTSISTAVIRTAEDVEMLVNEEGNQGGNGGERMGVKEEARRR